MVSEGGAPRDPAAPLRPLVPARHIENLNQRLGRMEIEQEGNSRRQSEVAPAAKWLSWKGIPFDKKRHGGHVEQWILQNVISMDNYGVPEEKRGVMLIPLLEAPDMALVSTILGISLSQPADIKKHTFQVVGDAIKRAVSAADDTDQGLLYRLQALKLDVTQPQSLRTVFQTAEQLQLKLAEPLSLQSRIFFMSLKVPQEHRSKFQFNAGTSWADYEAFKTNWMAQAALIEQTLAKQMQQKKQNDSKPGPSHGYGKKGRFHPYGKGKQQQHKQQQPNQQQHKQQGNGKQQRGPSRPCRHCGGNHYDNQCKSQSQVSEVAASLLQPVLDGTAIASQQVLYPKPSELLARSAAAVKTDIKGQSIRAQAWRDVAANGATAEQLQYLLVSCNAVLESPTVKALRAQHTYITDATCKTVLQGVFYACAAYPAELLSSHERTYQSVHSMVTALLPSASEPASGQGYTHIMCEAFTAADELAIYHGRVTAQQKEREQQLQAVAAATGSPTEAASELNGSASPAFTADSAAACTASFASAETGTNASTVDAASEAFAPGYLPIAADAFASIQQKLSVPCTVDAYATAASAVCTSYLPPTGGTVQGPVLDGNEPVMYWFNVPREHQHAYMKAYRTRKADNPSLGACWLLPHKPDAHMSQMMHGMQLLTTFSRNTLLFRDPATDKPVRSKCTLSVWFDAPSSAPPLETENMSDISQPESNACKVPTRPKMQVQASIAYKPGLVLLDSGAADHNYLSADFCKRHGLKLTPLQQPLTAIGVQGAGQVTHGCKLHVRMHTYTSWLDFKVISLPAEASFVAILGDKWLKDNNAILDYSRDCCRLPGSRKHILPAVTVPDTVEPTPTCMPSIVSYAQAKRMMNDPETAYYLMVVRPKPDTAVNASVTSSDAASAQNAVMSEQQLHEVLDIYPDVFTDHPPYGGSQIEADIEVIPFDKDERPVLRPMFRYSPFELEEMHKQIKQLLELGSDRQLHLTVHLCCLSRNHAAQNCVWLSITELLIS